ncbi:uncharacterized protein LOC117339033 [Pecten maximus]|uniref:uncharacterized protein LOC117339033 n=1 Tax=Pecten maximus TaxID=6579 RepID=UPI001458661B|nr:uncharacterized protein LOC117339033 [Pecten maximus]
MGDFNYPGINWETWNTRGESTETQEYKFMQKLQDNFFFHHVQEPTRWGGKDNPHILDLLITRDEHSLSSIEYQSPLGKSDHCVLIFNVICNIKVKLRSKKKICYKNADFDTINNELNKINWDEELQSSRNINENWIIFRKIIKEAENKHVPTKIITVGRNNKHSFPADQSTLEAIKKKHSLFRKAASSKDMEVRNQYNKAKNKVRKLTRNSRKEYEKNIALKAKTDPKAVWNYIKSKSTTKSEIGDLYTKTNDKTSTKVSSDIGKANILCKFFSSVFVKEEDEVTPQLNQREVIEEMTTLNITREKVFKLLINLKPEKSAGLDELHQMLLKNTASSLSGPLTTIFNQSLSTGTLPVDWKKARVSATIRKAIEVKQATTDQSV